MNNYNLTLTTKLLNLNKSDSHVRFFYTVNILVCSEICYDEHTPVRLFTPNKLIRMFSRLDWDGKGNLNNSLGNRIYRISAVCQFIFQCSYFWVKLGDFFVFYSN